MKTKLSQYLSIITFCCAYLLTCSASLIAEDTHKHHESSHDHSKHAEHSDDSIKLNPKQIREFEIAVATAASGSIAVKVSVPGETVVNEETLSHISARFPGIVKEVKKRVGDQVKAGEALASIESNESLSQYTIKSLIDGVVIDKHATLGELLQEDDIAFSIADLSSVWINLSIYQIDLPLVRNGQSVSLSKGHGQESTTGTIS